MFGLIALMLIVFAAVVFVIGKIVGPEPIELPIEVPVERTEP